MPSLRRRQHGVRGHDPGCRPLKTVRNDTPRLLPLVVFAWLVLVFVYWWPSGLEFRSDDYLAIVYGSDIANVAHDFVGPYQNAVRLALFHRPLITLSVAIDGWIGGGAPFFPLLMNVVAHAAAALVLFALLRRWVGPWSALAGAAFWSFHPGHSGAVSWMIGRVDTHATLLYLLALWIELRSPRVSRLALVVFVLGCWTKETCLTLPAAVGLLTIATAGAKAAAIRVRPWLWTLLAVLAVRLAVLGEVVGGYAADSHPSLVAAVAFWNHWVPRGAEALPVAAAVLAAACTLWFARRRLGTVAVALGLFVIGALPQAGARGDLDAMTDRYLHLPSTALAGAAALGGPLAPLLLLAAHTPRGLGERRALRRVGARVRALREAASRELTQHGGDPTFVEAPATIDGWRAFHVGTDRLGVAPFGDGRVVLPRRPVYAGIAAQRAAPSTGTAEAFYTGEARLDAGTLNAQLTSRTAWLGLRGIDAARFRVTAATSLGWLRTEVPARRGRLSVADLLLAVPTSRPAGASNLLQDLWPAIEVSLDPRPWLWLEALDARGTTLGVSRRPLRLPLARDVGLGLQAKRPRAWILAVLAAVAAVLALTTRRLRRPAAPKCPH